jgi:hypothetical protein
VGKGGIDGGGGIGGGDAGFHCREIDGIMVFVRNFPRLETKK